MCESGIKVYGPIDAFSYVRRGRGLKIDGKVKTNGMLMGFSIDAFLVLTENASEIEVCE